MTTTPFLRDVYIVDGARTPFLKAKGKPGPFSASDLAVNAARELLQRQPFSAKEIDEVIIGCVMPNPDEANIGRLVALRLGCGKSVPAWTVQRNCASGMQALDSAAKDIAMGRCDLVLAGGTEAMSRAPLLYNDKMVSWLASLMGAKTIGAKLRAWTKLNPVNLFQPVIALLKGLTDPIVNLNMGQTAENIAYRFNINREQMDQFALESHQRTASAQEQKHLTEVLPVFAGSGDFYTADDGVRKDSSIEKLASSISLNFVNCDISAPAIKPIFLPDAMMTPLCVVSFSNKSTIFENSSMTSRSIVLTEAFCLSKYNHKI